VHNYEIDGKPYEGWFAPPAVGGRHPLVLVAPTIMGCSAFEQSRAEALAERGYAALAIDMYGRGRAGTDREANGVLMRELLADRAQLMARINGALVAGRGLPGVDAGRVAAIGYCFGGLCVLDLARSGADVAGVASFHGLFDPPPFAAGPISAKVLCLHGYDDPMATPDKLLALATELTTAGVDWQVHAYGNTGHAFTNPRAASPQQGLFYQPAADRRSWRALLDFLEELFS